MSSEKPDWRQAVRDIGRHLAREDYPAGQLASLRRLQPDRREGAAFWLLLSEHAATALDDERAERALALTVNGMAIAHPFHRSPERRSLGFAMAEAEISEARLLRLLRTDAEALPGEVRRLARLMAAKGDAGRFDWFDVFALAYWPNDATRRRIAKDYYRRQYNLQNPKGEAA
jgi:hypothetical protein